MVVFLAEAGFGLSQAKTQPKPRAKSRREPKRSTNRGKMIPLKFFSAAGAAESPTRGLSAAPAAGFFYK